MDNISQKRAVYAVRFLSYLIIGTSIGTAINANMQYYNPSNPIEEANKRIQLDRQGVYLIIREPAHTIKKLYIPDTMKTIDVAVGNQKITVDVEKIRKEKFLMRTNYSR